MDGPRRRRALRRREPRRPLDRRPRRLRPHQLLRHQRRDATPPAGSASSASCTSAPTRSTARSRSGSSPRDRSARAPVALLGVEGGLRPDRALVPHHLRAAGDRSPAAPTTSGRTSSRRRRSRCSPPTCSTAARSRSTATASTYATGSTSTTTAPACTSCSTQGDAGRDLQHRRRQRDRQPRPGRPLLALLGQGRELVEYVDDRLGHDRRYSVDIAKVTALGWQQAAHARRGPGGDRGVVPRQPLVVGAAQAARLR